jgi:hypothetical protein
VRRLLAQAAQRARQVRRRQSQLFTNFNRSRFVIESQQKKLHKTATDRSKVPNGESPNKGGANRYLTNAPKDFFCLVFLFPATNQR